MKNRALRGILVLGTIFCCLPLLAATKSGVVLIDQSAALSGGISGACDTAGFPITICRSGSYRLASNLTVPAGVDGIRITASDVTIDLNGFTILGTGTCTGMGSSLSCTGSSDVFGIRSSGDNTTLRNGAVRGFGIEAGSGALTGGGIRLTGVGNLLEEIHASENAVGIDVIWAVVTKCTFDRNLLGAQVFFSQLKGNSASNNLFSGFALANSSATENASNGNGQYGFVGSLSLVSDSQASNNVVGSIAPFLNSPGNNSCNGSLC